VNPCQALQVYKLPNNGYYAEEVATSLIISHYHTTYIPFNISSITVPLSQLYSNVLLLQPMVNKQNNNFTKTQFFHLFKILNNTFETYAKLNIFEPNRKKRGLMNFIGTGIKFVTGNLDNTDLDTITQNLEIIKHNQLNTMHKINDLSSFAGNIVNKYRENIKILNENSKAIRSEFSKINNDINLMLSIQDQYIQITSLNQFLEKLLRIFSFAHLQTLDLEVLSLDEINEIWQYLNLHHPKNTLWPIKHISELSLICKTGLLILDEMAILAIKIPIFEKNICNLKFVYPIPNNESQILISPSKYYCNELWYKNCEETSSRWICSDPLINSCFLPNNCQYATVQNNYQVHTLTYKNSLLFCSKKSETIVENCFQFQKLNVQDCSLIQSQCDVIINHRKYSLAINNISIVQYPETIKLQATNFSINLQIRHLEDPTKIQEDLLEPIDYEKLIPQKQSQYYYLTSTIVCIILICSISIALYQWNKHRYLKAIPVKTLQKFINEDVEKSEGGGVISLE